MVAPSVRHRFPGIKGSWARFDGPAGTQMVDTAIDAMSNWMANGSNACAGGFFAASVDCGELLHTARATVGELLNADPGGIAFGPNTTTNVFSLSRAVGRTLRPGDKVVGTALDHDSNITPWRLAAEEAGADHVLAPFDSSTGNLDSAAVAALIDERTRWVTVPGASNLLGSIPNLAPIIDAAHAVGARVFVDAVHLAPHQPIDVADLGCDVLATSPYKWYGPHSGVIWIEPQLLDDLPLFKVRPAHDEGPERFETGMANFEAIAGIEAAARFLIEHGMTALATAERTLFAPLLSGLQAIDGVKVWGEQSLDRRTPTAAFTIEGISPADVTKVLAGEHIAVWDGHN
ncbi:MAG: aminotransferase class V-fold PLP-dependent enzyme, partial [Ilumatobacteraceae bacterium]